MDESLTAFMNSFATLARLAQEQQPAPSGEPLAPVLEQYLGFAPHTVSVLTETFGNHRLADANIVLEEFASHDPEATIIGIAGQERNHMDLADMLDPGSMHVSIAEPIFTSLAVGPGQQRRFLAYGIHLFKHLGKPLAVALRRADPRFGRETCTLEIIAADPQAGDAFVAGFREQLRETSVFRGHVISFKPSDYGNSNAGVAFHERPKLGKDELILPEGVRERISEQVLGIGLNRDFLRSHGVHLKRGVLLYGPPGTGKTHTVRYLTSEAEGQTVILLNGNTLPLVSEATAMARALQPAVVVLEDCDLIAEDRHFGHGPQPLLFEVLDSLDGLDADADVAFVLTTNRVESLERALVQRPGRIDLAVEIPRPELEGRLALLKLYGGHVHASEETLAEVAQLIEGTTASFVKELIRRTVLIAAIKAQSPKDEDLLTAARELMSDQALLTRNLLGGTSNPDEEDFDDDGEASSFGYIAHSPMSGSYFPMALGEDETDLGFKDE
ncbi:ATPase [Glutamicibacter uratoxydans]|uniref:ATPase n=1 Tax=Glutamicibacter uratoxydans TaxID=43667 RepID=A0A4Y4DQE9_GLUUR|nr:ATP-binding protein [Glutamicibacter uratoxydans]GED06144.1 ATPase [Glutamicibacter uratoxydans]